ncbi:RidA family protein [Nonomuraea sp. NBC_00507]|uniref:RidA family protein n=1 Tax=Nonomuraea sp. NBC_00507 TaxID=2976002 RepID=UPI003FA57FD3
MAYGYHRTTSSRATTSATPSPSWPAEPSAHPSQKRSITDKETSDACHRSYRHLGRPVGNRPYSQAVRTGDLLFVSGQLPLHPETGAVCDNIEEQTRQSLTSVTAVVREAGGQLSDVVRVGIFVTDIKDFGVVNKVYAEFFSAETRPARAVVKVSALPRPEARIEIEAIAAIGASSGNA